MFDCGYRPDRGYVKCARVVGDVMGQLPPARRLGDLRRAGAHGPAVVAALPADRRQRQLRLARQRPAGRHAVLRHRQSAGPHRRRARSGSATSSRTPSRTPTHDIDLKVHDRNGDPVRASKFFHSGEHPTLRLRTREGFELTGTHNHPVLCLVNVAGVPTLLWKLLDEIRPGDRVVMQRVVRGRDRRPDARARRGGRSSPAPSSARAGSPTSRAGFNNADRDYFARVLAAYDAAVGGRAT